MFFDEDDWSCQLEATAFDWPRADESFRAHDKKCLGWDVNLSEPRKGPSRKDASGDDFYRFAAGFVILYLPMSISPIYPPKNSALIWGPGLVNFV